VSTLFPRLDAHLAEKQITGLAKASPESIANTLTEPRLEVGETYAELGGTRIRLGELAVLQRELRAIARQYGFPHQPNTQKAQQFDQRTAGYLVEKMRITAHEAAQPSVWQYLCCMAVPDIVRWRFPGEEGRGTSVERFLGGRRNTLGRLWWRAYVLRDDDKPAGERYNLMKALGEDELVQLMERPAVFGDRRLVRAAATAFLAEASRTRQPRQTLMREIQKRLIRRMPLTFFGALTDAQLKAAMNAIAQDASACIAPQDEFVSNSS
jgi:hypothetical protein